LIKSSFEQAARTRWAMPVVIALAAAAMVVNEWTYQHTRRALDHNIALADARIETTKARQILSEMEAAARALLASGTAADRQRFEKAASELPLVERKALALIAKVDPHGVVAVDGVRSQTQEQAQRLRAWVDAAPAAGSAEAPDSGGEGSRIGITELQHAFDDMLDQAATIQQHARVTLYDAFLFSRVAVHALLLLSLLSFYLFARQLRRSDAQRALDNQRLEREIGERTAELRDLARHLVSVREDERARLARELHDEMGGLLTAMKLELARLRRVQQLPQDALERASGIESRLNDGIALKRRIIENLHPSSLDQLGLKVALEALCADSAAMIGIPVHAELEDVALGNKDAELTLYRLVQESLTNIAKYAQAREVRVNLQRSGDGDVTLTVRDDGRGFDPDNVNAGHHGLLGMRIRLEAYAGSLRVDSAPGKGTRIVATMPVAPAAH
jgi:signal transduction histidine kinase